MAKFKFKNKFHVLALSIFIGALFSVYTANSTSTRAYYFVKNDGEQVEITLPMYHNMNKSERKRILKKQNHNLQWIVLSFLAASSLTFVIGSFMPIQHNNK